MSKAGLRAIIDDSQIDLNVVPCQIIAKCQVGEEAGDHCLQINHKVTCNGNETDKFTKLKLYPGLTDVEKKTVCVIQCTENNLVLAISKNKVCAKIPNVDYSDVKLVVNIDDIDPETLFERVLDKSNPTYYSFRLLHDENKVIGFDTQGEALTPDSVAIGDEESLFSVWSE